MATALVVDDSKIDQRLASQLLANRADLDVIVADHGRQALDLMKQRRPDFVLTDMKMPEMDGLELVDEVRKLYPMVPVILMTAHGSEDVAAEALRRGAASYVPKKYLSRDLAETVQHVLALAGAEREQQKAIECLEQAECRFTLGNDPDRLDPLLRYLRQDLTHLHICDETETMRVTVAIREALDNAIEHGNLEGSNELQDADAEGYRALLEQRRREPPYCDRHVHLASVLSPTQATYVVRDEGYGFNTSLLPDPADPANFERTHGRGLMLIRTFMDEVRYNDAGNEITMTKRKHNGHKR